MANGVLWRMSGLTQIKDGKLRALVRSWLSRYRGGQWVGVLVPARTPTDIVTLLQREIVRIIALSDMKERLPTLGFETVGSTPDEFASQIRTEIEIRGKIIREAGIRA